MEGPAHVAGMRRFLVALFRALLRVFYRRVEVTGLENVPTDRGIVYAVNHPNGLIDPMFIVCFSPRPVSFLAKAPLFRYPVIGWFVRVFDAIPVYRKQDGLAGSNRDTFARAREILAAGGGVAIFPEGTTHSDPKLRALKTGAARIALGTGSTSVVPAGIYYSAKQRFRSDALVAFGPPVAVAAAPLDADGEPGEREVRLLTEAIDQALARVTLQADSRPALELVEAAEEIFSATAPPSVASEFVLRKRFVDGYRYLEKHDPERLVALSSRVERFSAELGRAGLEPHELEPRFRPAALMLVLLLVPIAVAGVLANYLPYRIAGMISKRLWRGEVEMVATVKLIASMLLFPLTWAGWAVVFGQALGRGAAADVFAGAAVSGWVAIRVSEKLDTAIGRLRALVHRGRSEELVREREAIRNEFASIAEELERA